IEVGPGLGVLTRELAEGVTSLITVELDNRLATILKKTLASYNNITVINGDILKLAPSALLQEQKGSRLGYKVVANLPYYITAHVIRHFLEASPHPQIMVIMVQKEVAEAIVAKPDRMSRLSVSVQFYGQPSIVSYVPRRCFYPSPEVDSAILKIATYARPLVAVTDKEGFFRLVRAGFTASRKQLVNSLSQGLELPRGEILTRLEKAGIVPKRRAETLTLAEWAELWRVFN
ncbi:MAG: ribosomal RNA small subunit methyltransferase A, partial [Dehalococcoidales bacterium]|nr:ribosomal RNA small subunit methyltransferase A [Dehalococcoidales bacterium]